MSDLFQGKKGNLTGQGLKDLAKLVIDHLPKGSVVTVASVGLRYDSVADGLLMEDEIEMESTSNCESGAPVALSIYLDARIHDAIMEMMDSDDWTFDTLHSPALVFSVESDCDYYVLVAVAIDANEPFEIDETMLVGEIIHYIDANAPEAECIEESDPTVSYVYGSLTSAGEIFAVDFEEQDD